MDAVSDLDLGNFETRLTFLGQFLSSFFGVPAHLVVRDLQGCVHKWLVLSAIHMNPGF